MRGVKSLSFHGRFILPNLYSCNSRLIICSFLALLTNFRQKSHFPLWKLLFYFISVPLDSRSKKTPSIHEIRIFRFKFHKRCHFWLIAGHNLRYFFASRFSKWRHPFEGRGGEGGEAKKYFTQIIHGLWEIFLWSWSFVLCS